MMIYFQVAGLLYETEILCNQAHKRKLGEHTFMEIVCNYGQR